MQYRGDGTGAEERVGASRYGAHSAGVTTPACSLDAWLPRKCFETRGTPPSLSLCPRGVEESWLEEAEVEYGEAPVPGPPPMQGGAALPWRHSTQIRVAPPPVPD